MSHKGKKLAWSVPKVRKLADSEYNRVYTKLTNKDVLDEFNKPIKTDKNKEMPDVENLSKSRFSSL